MSLILVAENILRIVPMGTHEWNQYMNPEEIANILHPLGLRNVAQTGAMIINPLTMEMDEFPNWMRGNYLMMFKRLG